MCGQCCAKQQIHHSSHTDRNLKNWVSYRKDPTRRNHTLLERQSQFRGPGIWELSSRSKHCALDWCLQSNFAILLMSLWRDQEERERHKHFRMTSMLLITVTGIKREYRIITGYVLILGKRLRSRLNWYFFPIPCTSAWHVSLQSLLCSFGDRTIFQLNHVSN